MGYFCVVIVVVFFFYRFDEVCILSESFWCECLGNNLGVLVFGFVILVVFLFFVVGMFVLVFFIV